MSSSFAADVAAFADAGCDAMEVWLTKLEKHVEEQNLESAKALLEQRGVQPVVAAYQGGLLLSQGDQRREHFGHFQRRLSLCQSLGIPTLMLVADFVDEV